MRNLILLLIIGLILGAGYGYKKNPKACQKLGLDMVNDTRAIFMPSGSTNSAQEPESVASAPPSPPSPPATPVSPSPVPSPSPVLSQTPLAPPPQATPVPSPAPTSQSTPAPQVAVEPGTLLANGDFSQGDSNWEGDGSIDPSVGRAMVVLLKKDSWTRVSQDFTGTQGTADTLTLHISAAPGLIYSHEASDYGDVAEKIRFEDFGSYPYLRLTMGCFLYWIGDLTNHTSQYDVFPFRDVLTTTVTIQKTLPANAPLAQKIVVLAFPPGTGKIIIRSISVTSN